MKTKHLIGMIFLSFVIPYIFVSYAKADFNPFNLNFTARTLQLAATSMLLIVSVGVWNINLDKKQTK